MLDVDLKVVQQINFTGNLDIAGQTTTFFIIDEVKETIFDFSQGAVKILNVVATACFTILFCFHIVLV